MKTSFLWIAPAALLSACATPSGPSSKDPGQVTYFDRNGDGNVDLERHHYPQVLDRDWVLQDDDYNGRFEKQVFYGVETKETAIDLPVPAGVLIKNTR